MFSNGMIPVSSNYMASNYGPMNSSGMVNMQYPMYNQSAYPAQYSNNYTNNPIMYNQGTYSYQVPVVMQQATPVVNQINGPVQEPVAYHPIMQPVNPPIMQPVNPPIMQTVNPPIVQTVNTPIMPTMPVQINPCPIGIPIKSKGSINLLDALNNNHELLDEFFNRQQTNMVKFNLKNFYKSLSLDKLQTILSIRKQQTHGKKEDLLERIISFKSLSNKTLNMKNGKIIMDSYSFILVSESYNIEEIIKDEELADKVFNSSQTKEIKEEFDLYYNTLTCDEIKAILRIKKLPVSGVKKVILERVKTDTCKHNYLTYSNGNVLVDNSVINFYAEDNEPEEPALVNDEVYLRDELFGDKDVLLDEVFNSQLVGNMKTLFDQFYETLTCDELKLILMIKCFTTSGNKSSLLERVKQTNNFYDLLVLKNGDIY